MCWPTRELRMLARSRASSKVNSNSFPCISTVIVFKKIVISSTPSLLYFFGKAVPPINNGNGCNYFSRSDTFAFRTRNTFLWASVLVKFGIFKRLVELVVTRCTTKGISNQSALSISLSILSVAFLTSLTE